MGIGMQKTERFLAVIVAAALAAGAAIVPGYAQPKPPAVFDGLQKGEWSVRFRDGSAARKLCIRSGNELVQLRHEERNCSQFVVEDTPGEATVQYTCRGNGYGRTNVRRETASLVQIESQGIVDGSPFQFQAEARRTGNCQ